MFNSTNVMDSLEVQAASLAALMGSFNLSQKQCMNQLTRVDTTWQYRDGGAACT